MNKFFLILLLSASFFAKAQTDTIITRDNNILVGEIKEMTKGVLTFKTSYSDSDFKIEWLNIKSIISTREFRIILTNGARLMGTINTGNNSSIVVITDKKDGIVKVETSYIVYMKHISSGNILDAINLSLDIGYSYTKANQLHQLNSDIKGNYYSNVWGVNGFMNTVQNVQSNAEPTKRTNGGGGFRYFLRRNYFGAIDADFFSNNEQMLDLRSNYNISIGKFFVNTNRMYFNTTVGIAYSYENYSDTLTDRKSVEGKLGLSINMFDIGDINVLSNVIFYPSITEKYRLRTTINFTLKYDLPRDFYIKIGLDYNYDTKPIDNIDPDDYVITSGIGWEL